VSEKAATPSDLSRAERVRNRRKAEQEHLRKTKPVRKTDRQPRASSNATTDSPFARSLGIPDHIKHPVSPRELKKPSVNHRVVIPLNKQGAELEFSTFPVMRFGWRALSILLAASCIAALVFLYSLQVTQPRISGVDGYLKNEITSYLALEGTSIFMIQPAALAAGLQAAFPEVTTARVSVQLPAQVNVVIEAREPVYAWKLSDRVYLIEPDGLLYPALPYQDISQLTVIKADILPEVKLDLEHSPDILAEIISYVSQTSVDASAANLPRRNTYLVEEAVMVALEQILQYLPENGQLIYHRSHGFGWIDEKGWDAYFGVDMEQITMKMAVYSTIISKLEFEGRRPSLVSVEYLHAPYFRED
jgi:cell division protein FtsQ